MAGFFGLFDYSKPGPGVFKNGPQKKRFFLFWELYARKFFRLCVANMLYILVSVPVVTGGMAEAALTYVTRNYVREKHVFLPDDFFATIKKNWKQALGMQVIDIVATAVIAIGLWFYGYPVFSADSGDGSIVSTVLFAVMILVALTWRMMRYYVYLQMITFRMTLKQILKNSLKFVLIGLKENVIISVILFALYAVLGLSAYLFFPLSAVIVGALFVLFIPAFRSFLIQFMIFPTIKTVIIDPYYAEHPDEDIEARRDLNIETGEEEPTEDVIFEDRSESESPSSGVNIPKQYSADEMRRAKRLTKADADLDDDGTI